MAEPTGVLTYQDLIIEVAYFLGIADYDGSGNPAIPIDNQDLVLAKRIVNKAIRMFINDAPPQGWRWTTPVQPVTLWADVTVGATTVSGGAYDAANDQTLITASAGPTFYQTMELKDIVITTNGTFNIKTYVSPTTVYVSGDAHLVSAKTFSIASSGNFTLPQTFGGQFTSKITYAAGTNQGIQCRWAEESNIRTRRENVTSFTGIPYEFAVRVMPNSGRRRWELLSWFQPNALFTVQFAYVLYFDKLVNLTDSPPAPFGHDETIRAVCLAVAEMDVRDIVGGPKMTYYRETCLKASYQVDNLSVTKAIGYVGDPGAPKTARAPNRDWRDTGYQRPTVGVNTGP